MKFSYLLPANTGSKKEISNHWYFLLYKKFYTNLLRLPSGKLHTTAHVIDSTLWDWYTNSPQI